MALLQSGLAKSLAEDYTIDQSLRFDDGDSPSLSRTPASAGDRKTWTFSFWTKRGNLSDYLSFIGAAQDSSNRDTLRFANDDTLNLQWTRGGSSNEFFTDALFRDVGAWYHIVLAVDTTISTPSADRVKMWVNGVVQTFSTANEPDEDGEFYINDDLLQVIGARSTDGSAVSSYYDGYMAEVYFIDGTQYAASDFGEFDEDSPTIWKPKDASGLTFGTNGFYLDFEASANLGNDANGGTDLTEVNLAAADQATDTPTNNFATVNPLDNYYQGHAFSQGNCKVTSTNSDTSFHTSTFAVSSGKWYAEVKVDGTDDSGGTTNVGIAGKLSTSTTNYIGADAQHFAYRANEGNKETGGSNSSYGSGWGDNALIGIYLDLDNNKLYFSEDGTLQNSGTGISITAPASVDMGAYVMGAGDRHTGAHIDLVWNFGGCPSFTVSSAVADDNGYGSFEYSPNITGDSEAKKFYALNTKNLAEYGG